MPPARCMVRCGFLAGPSDLLPDPSCGALPRVPEPWNFTFFVFALSVARWILRWVPIRGSYALGVRTISMCGMPSSS